MAQIRQRHLVIGSGILLVGFLAWLFLQRRGGEEDPPPIIVSGGGSIMLELQGADAGYLDKIWLSGTWYHQPDTVTQHQPEWIDVTVYGGVDNDTKQPCTTYANVATLFIEYGGTKKMKIDVGIGYVLLPKFGEFLKFAPRPANGTQNSNARKKVDFDEGETVYLDSVAIHYQAGGKPVTCTFTPLSLESKIGIQEKHTPPALIPVERGDGGRSPGRRFRPFAG